MKILKIKLAWVVLLFIWVFLFACAEGWGANWKYFTSSHYGDSFYDADGITRQQNGMVRVWYKEVLNDEGRIDWVAKVGEKVKDVSYVMDLIELDCKGKMDRLLIVTSYSKAGIVLESSQQYSIGWDLIYPDSVFDVLFNIVCR